MGMTFSSELTERNKLHMVMFTHTNTTDRRKMRVWYYRFSDLLPFMWRMSFLQTENKCCHDHCSQFRILTLNAINQIVNLHSLKDIPNDMDHLTQLLLLPRPIRQGSCLFSISPKIPVMEFIRTNRTDQVLGVVLDDDLPNDLSRMWMSVLWCNVGGPLFWLKSGQKPLLGWAS